MDIHEYIRNRITELRINKNISESALSIELGHSRSYLATINRDKTIPSIQSLVDICDYFDITLAEFFANYVSNIKEAKSPIQLDLIKEVLAKSSTLSENELDILLTTFKTLTKDNIKDLSEFFIRLKRQ